LFVLCVVAFKLAVVVFSEPRKDAAAAASESIDLNDAEEVRPPLPVIRETLYDDAMLYGYVLPFIIYFFALLEMHIIRCFYRYLDCIIV